MAPSRLPPSYPPTYHHRTAPATPSKAQTFVAAYIKSSEKHPYLHPTSLLSTTGITHGPNSGPTGGLAMHHLRRIEAGLRGESLIAETREELIAKFGDSEVSGTGRMMSAALDQDASEIGLVQGDDTGVDNATAATTVEEGGPKRKRNKDEKEKGSKKRKKDADEIAAWAEESSKAGSPADDAQDMVEFQQSQQPIIGEVGERDAMSKSKQNGAPPVVLPHDSHGNIKPPEKAKTDQEKRERNAAKKQRNKAMKAAKHKTAAEPAGD